MKPPSRHDLDLVKTVQAHVRNLMSLSGHEADEATLRIATGTLRALLSEEMLQRASHWPSSSAYIPDLLHRKGWRKMQSHICGGGDIIAGVPFSACHNAELKRSVLNLKDFCRQTRILVGDDKASTTDIIKYVANALGAAHYDPIGKAARKYDLYAASKPAKSGSYSFLRSTTDIPFTTKFSRSHKLSIALLKFVNFCNGLPAPPEGRSMSG